MVSFENEMCIISNNLMLNIEVLIFFSSQNHKPPRNSFKSEWKTFQKSTPFLKEDC